VVDSRDLNTRVVLYNLFLSLYFEAYINVEIYNTVAAIRYIYKYIFKGYDLFYATVKERVDEPIYRLSGRYLGPYKSY
jgi:hypothetical protein